MKKRGQSFTTYIVLLIVILAGISFIIYFKSKSQGNYVFDYEFKSDVDTLKDYISSCLEETTLQAIEIYGIDQNLNHPADRGTLSNSEPLLTHYIENQILDCIDVDQFPSLILSFEKPVSTITIQKEIIISDLALAVEIKQGEKTKHLSEFSYLLERTKIKELSYDGLGKTKGQQILITDDQRATLIIPQGVNAKNAEGEQIDFVSVKITEKHFENLNNNVVIGPVVFDAKPDGATFNPPLNMKIQIKYNEVPYGFPPKEMKCAYYDEQLDIWRAYPTKVTDNSAERTYTLDCDIDHFSVIAAVRCGQETKEYALTFEPIYQAPIEPIQPMYWMYNDENIQDGLHVIPEEVGECDLNRGDGENIIHYLSDKDTCEDLLDDWDEDDQESGPYIFQYVIDIDGNYGTLETISNAKNEIGAKEIRYGGYTVQLTPSGFGDFAERCTQSCEQKAEEDLNQYLDEPIITNDGINDNIQKLFCKLKLNAIKNPSDVITHYEVQALPSSPDDCMVAEEETIQFPFDNINDPYERGETVTMDYPEKKSVFYATPETYGYLKTLGNSYTAEYGSWDNFKPVLGGEADFSFYIETEGSNCRDDSIGNFEVKLISTDLPEPEYNLESEEPLIIPDQIKTMDLFTGTLEDLYIECSDQCIWTLNEEDTEPGNLHAGDNLIKVRVNNIKDPAVYSNAVFKFKGEGLHVGGNQFVPSAPGGSSSGSSVVGGGTFYDPGYTGTTSAGGTFQTPLGKPVDFQISGSCGDAAEQAIKGVMELQCKYADVGDAYDPTCSGGLSCAQFVDWAFVNGMGLDEVWANGNGWCDVASMEKLGNDNKFQPGDVFSQDFGSVGHAGMIIGKGKVSNLVSSSYTTRNGQQMCYTQFKPDSGGEVVYAHSYGWISGGVAYGRSCFTPQSVFEKAFSDAKTVYCRRDVCS